MSRVCQILFLAPVIAVLMAVVSPIRLDGHAGIHERLRDMNQRIASDPDNADLYVKRGELYRLHRDWDAALADYARAAQRDPESDLVFFVRGRMLFEAGRWEEAQAALDRVLRTKPDHREGLLTRARLLVKREQPLAAIADYDKVIAGLDNPTPEYYLERAKALVAAGSAYIPRALAGVDEGIGRLGPIYTLVEFAIDLDLSVERYDEALGRLDQLKPSMAPERWLHRRGFLLGLMGRTDEARRAYSRALQSLRSAPIRRQSTRAAKEFEAELVSLLGSPDTE